MEILQVKILIIKLKTIGDVILTTPLISNLKAQYPESIVDFLVNKGTEEVLNCNPKINHILTYEREKIKEEKGIKRIFNELHLFLEIRKTKYDIVIDLDQGDRGGLISKFSGAKIKVGNLGIKNKLVSKTYTHFMPEPEGRHIVERMLDPLRVLKIPIKSKKVEICWSEKDKQVVDELLQDTSQFVHIHPFSRVEVKELDTLTLSQIIDFFEIELNIRTVITAAPISRELSKVKKVLLNCQSKPINLGGKLSLAQTAYLNKKSTMFVGVDTAIMHISAANSTPTLAFFGPSVPDVWGPWNNQVGKAVFHRLGGIQKHANNVVFADKRVCLPCNQEHCFGKETSDCLSSLSVEDIKKNILTLIKSKVI